MITIDRYPEWELSRDQQDQIHALLDLCFSGYPDGKTFYRQLPAFRYLIFNKKKLIGHCGIESRVINNNGGLRRIFGLADLCIHPDHQNTGIGNQLLDRIINDASRTEYDYIISLSSETDFYTKNGFTICDTFCRWLILADDKSFGLVHRKLENCLLVYLLKDDVKWDPAFADFLGSLF